MLLGVCVASNTPLLINKAAVKVFLHWAVSGSWALHFSHQHKCNSCLGQATLSLGHLAHLPNQRSRSRISFDVSGMACSRHLGGIMLYCVEFPLTCRKLGISVLFIRCRLLQQPRYHDNAKLPVIWEAAVRWPLSACCLSVSVLISQTLVRVP